MLEIKEGVDMDFSRGMKEIGGEKDGFEMERKWGF